MTPELQTFPDAEALAAALAAEVAGLLRDAIAARGRATLAVPGGTTPGRFLTLLGQAVLDWEKVGVTLTDERWVPLSSPRSNQRLLAETLFAGPAAAAEFAPLYGATPEPEMALGAIAASLTRIVLPLDVCVLGMGEDMHTASLFPGALGLEAALAPGAPPVLAITAPGAGEPRITLTAPVLAGAGQVYLLIRGAAKRAALERALAAPSALEAPVRAVLDGAARVSVYYAD
ncbi:MAG TPA: 6-phosphogluconolactonase [Thermohalobaculum sp.]|nr:6-phosphogluconolactonase [Thermohalobaculum sp.]